MANTPNRADPSARPAKTGQGNSIAAGGKLEGKFHFNGPVIIGAEIIGDVDSDDLILVEAGGRIEGRVRAATLIIHGAVKGDVEASLSLEVCIGGRLEGFAFSPSMKVEERTVVSADMLIAPERSPAHISRAASAPGQKSVASLTPPRSDTPAEASAKTAAG